MANSLVIVESPAKVKTIKKFLGSTYEVDASNGHVRDLPKSQLGIDVENDYEPKYITIRGKGDILAKLRKEVKKADKIYLATDPDREGEAISWHLMKALKLDEVKDKKVYSTHHGLPREVYDVAVFEYLAKTFYPEEFADVDPEGTLKEFYDKFLPFSYGGVWFMHLN